jgi:hypothetical protein
MRELRPGDSIVYLFDRDHVSEADLETIDNTVLKRMAQEWRRQYAHRFFATVARNYQPIAGTGLNTFDSHDDSVLFADKTALLEHLPRLASSTPGFIWVILATRDVEDAVRAVILPNQADPQ